MLRKGLYTLFTIVPVLLILCSFFLSCSSSSPSQNPVSPSITDSQQLNNGSDRILWGYWEGVVSDSLDSVAMSPVRNANFHLNARRMLENTWCTECLKVLGGHANPEKTILYVDIEITHPYADIYYTGFDVRGILITNGSMYFPAMDETIAYTKMGDFTCINPDGYTKFWNTNDFPPGSGPFPILEYSKGNFAWPGKFSATVNPFIKFSEEPRDHFPAGGSITRTFELNIIPGPMWFGYAVDASWEPPLVEPVTDIWTDFPPTANALEPSVLSVYNPDEPVTSNIADYAHYRFWLVDRQSSLIYVISDCPFQMECPVLFDGVYMARPDSYSNWDEYLWKEFWGNVRFYNRKGTEPGIYPVLFRIKDPRPDKWLGDINFCYHFSEVPVVEPAGEKIKGLMAYKARLGEDGQDNVWLMDLDNAAQYQTTDFKVPTELGEVRINPSGTHILWDSGTSVWDHGITVHQVGGGKTFISPSGAYDGDADFHPDGQHILVASGVGSSSTTTLWSMRYDGSERTYIATAPHPISDPRWSPDGSMIVMTLDDDPDPGENSLYIYDISLGEFKKIADAPGLDENPSWSPVPVDSNYLVAFDSDRYTLQWEPRPHDLCFVDPETGLIVKHIGFGFNGLHVSLSPQCEWLVIGSKHYDSNQMGSGIAFINYETEEYYILLENGDMYYSSPSWCWTW